VPEAEACAFAEEPRRIVGGQAGPEQGAGSAGHADLAQSRLARGAGVGVRSGEGRELASGGATNSAGARAQRQPLAVYVADVDQLQERC
jgi:hypothetical protein